MTGLDIEGGAAIRRARTAKAWSQRHLAEVAGLDERTVRRIEAGKTADPASVAAVREALGTMSTTPAKPDTSKDVSPSASALVRYVASIEAIDGFWTSTDVPAWLAARGWDEAGLARAGADYDEAYDREQSWSLATLGLFLGTMMVSIGLLPLVGEAFGDTGKVALGDGFAAAALVAALVTWVLLTRGERRRRRAEAKLGRGREVVAGARWLNAQVHVLGTAGLTTFGVAGAGRLHKAFVPVEAMRVVSEERLADGHVTLTVRTPAGVHVLAHLPDMAVVCAVAEGWRRAVDGIGSLEVAA